ncbi:hypothetical protein V7654_19560 [Bacillus sp. JJ1609]|uniref:hypothetical protein n=1 Tax=Bacillus sp. JJ1609 TaxID=3122977 RepID=UPI002FFE09E4
MNPKLLLLIGIAIDLILIIFLSTMIDEIGILFFVFMVIILLGGTFFVYSMITRNNQKR